MSNVDEKAMSDVMDRHLAAEFGERSSEKAVETMVPHPHVNLVPLMAGGVGREEVKEFYAKQLLAQIPPDFKTTPISRTIGKERLVDEYVAHFTHSIQMDWLLPGMPPTGKYLEIPTVVIAHIQDGKIVSEHIYWDQASVLVQLGLIDRSLPVRGAEIAKQALEPTQPMNALLHRSRQR